MSAVRRFFRHDAASGVILLIAAALALLMDNSPLAPIYDKLLSVPVTVTVSGFGIDKPLLLWINDGLMVVFFFFVGLEIKKEIIKGELSSFDKAALPAAAAIGGMAVPAAIFAYLNRDLPTIDGWAIPAATDIAFALGILALLGPRVPPALKVFLLALAIIDDLGAIIIIALFYTSQLSLTALGIAAVGTTILIGMNRMGVRGVAPYMLIGLCIWLGVLKSGVHATLAGVVLALAIPMLNGPKEEKESPLERLEHGLKPWVAFFVMPVFAFANSGVSLSGLSVESFTEPLALGIALGLFLGKQVGVMSFVWAAARMGICKLPEGVNWMNIYGVSMLAGIGFTMSLFIGALAFTGVEEASSVRIGVLTGSILSAICGYLVLNRTLPQPRGVSEKQPSRTLGGRLDMQQAD